MEDELSPAMRALISQLIDEKLVAYDQARREALAEPLMRVDRLIDLAITEAGETITPLIQAVDNLMSIVRMPVPFPAEQERADPDARVSPDTAI